MRWTGIAAIGVGAIGGGLAIKFAGDEREKEDEIDRVCAVSCSSGQLRALQDDQQAAHRNAVIAGIAGGALVVTGVILVITSRAPSPARTTSVSLGATDGGFGISYAKTY